MKRKLIVETDSLGRDYPFESFLPVGSMPEEDAKTVADLINKSNGPDSTRYWKVVDLGYELDRSTPD